MTEQAKKGPGQGRGGKGGGGFEFGRGRDGDGRGGGRDGRRGDKREGGGAGFKVVNELSGLEKAMTKTDFAAQKAPLDAILRAVRPMRLKSLEDLDLNTRGRLLTSLMRVARQPKPKVSEAAPADAAAPVEAAPTEALAEGASTETAPVAEGATAETAPAVEAAPAAPQVDPAVTAYRDVMWTVGLIWRATGEVDRAAPAFEAAGRQPTESDLAAPAQTQTESAPRKERTERKDRGGERGERPARERTARPPREARPEKREKYERPEPFVSTGDWKQDVELLEKAGRTRDAGRIYEKNGAHEQAMKVFENGGDLRAALRNAVQGKLDATIIEALMAKLKPEEIEQTLERISAWEQLMAFHVKRQAFEAVAKLYERANQFDQAGLAWERAQKLSQARKAYERARDFAAANRVRDLEVVSLVQRGDRLGAATLLMAAGRRRDAVESLNGLPGPKAYSFMQKLKLNEEADIYAKAQLAQAETSGNHSHRARWLEVMGDLPKAAEAYLTAERKDKASHVFEAMGQLPKAAELAEAAGQLDRAQQLFTKAGDAASAERVAAMPRPVKAPAPVEPAEGEGEAVAEAAPPPSVEPAVSQGPTAQA